MGTRQYVMIGIAAAVVFGVAGYAYFHSLPIALAEGLGVGLAVVVVARVLLALAGKDAPPPLDDPHRRA